MRRSARHAASSRLTADGALARHAARARREDRLATGRSPISAVASSSAGLFAWLARRSRWRLAPKTCPDCIEPRTGPLRPRPSPCSARRGCSARRERRRRSASRSSASRPGAPGEQQARLVRADAEDNPACARSGRIAWSTCSTSVSGARHDQEAVRRPRGEILVEVARRHRRVDPALLELDRLAVLLVHDRRVEDGVAGLQAERRGDLLVGGDLFKGLDPAAIGRRRGRGSPRRCPASRAASSAASPARRTCRAPARGRSRLRPSARAARDAPSSARRSAARRGRSPRAARLPSPHSPVADAVDHEPLHLLVERLRRLGAERIGQRVSRVIAGRLCHERRDDRPARRGVPGLLVAGVGVADDADRRVGEEAAGDALRRRCRCRRR